MNETKILLTGATGFIGQELLKRLMDMDNAYEVHVLERYMTKRYSLEQKQDYITHYASLTDYPAIKNIVHEVKPDYVIHLAAISPVSFSYEHPIEVNEINYLGSINLAEACRREVPEFKQYIFAGTSEEYGMNLSAPNVLLTEESSLMPNSPYAVSKVATDFYLRYMGLAYNFPYTIMRSFNSFGRKDNTHFFIERTITQMLSQNKVYLGDPTAIRSWLYVDDHVEGYLQALGNPKAIGEAFNLCTDKAYTTKETAELIAKLMKFKGKIIWKATPQRPLDAKILYGDNTKVEALLGWKPRYSLEEGLKKSIKYWKKWKKDATTTKTRIRDNTKRQAFLPKGI